MTEAPVHTGNNPGLADELTDRAASMAQMFVDQGVKSADREAFRYRGADQQWMTLTWRETQTQVFELAAGLISLGLQPEQRVSIAATTRMEWILADLAIMCAGGAVTTVYPTTQHDDVAYIMDDAGVSIAIVEDAEQLEKVREHPELYDRLTALVIINGSAADEKVHSWEQLRGLGREKLADQPDLITDIVAGLTGEHLATLIYTSGTTGRPKGVEIPHDSWSYIGRAVELFGILDPDDVQFLWLPLSHVFGKALLSIQLQIGFRTAVDGRIESIVDGLAEVKPTWMAGAPRIFEKVRAKVMMGTQGGLKGKIARWAFSVGQRTAPYRLAGKPIPKGLARQEKLADKLVFSKLRDRLGGNMRFMVSGSAKLSKQVQDWFYAAGLLIIEGYGLTETSAVSFVNDPRATRFGTVGPPMPGMAVKIADDGEVLLSGPGVARGYHNKPEETAESFVDGWFHTGDIGELDDHGYLRITDRKKDLMKTSGGKYVAPQKVEGTVVANCPYASQVVIYGDGRKFITALIALDPEAITAWAEENGLSGKSVEELVDEPKVRELIKGYVDQANTRLERWETVKDFVILGSELSVEAGEVTPSMKIRRKAVVRRYQDQLDDLYPED
ncbi:AMP-dependent synthetase/ligase [Naumannella halotolerans]|uniref:Acyl-CoA synthetase n=1 Tax=Naumannella halotolerans TaxID=993414 RepID=A0A4R7JBQ1_9ACTN|nr:long-chain fatty acid--CoA ligase [Naumannella halotolerans]TDT34043.1 long-chain acyl-CoA synthetase [Naumannella halotolerans]